MKKQIRICLLAVMVILAACFNGCSNRVEEVTEAPTNAPTEHQAMPETQSQETTGYQPPAYTEAEIQAAMDAVKAKFDTNFTDCQMLRLEYIEGKYLDDYEYYAKRCAVDRVIVLESDYSTGPNVSPSLNANHTYHNWKWILIDDGSGWSVWTNGYA